MLILEPIVPGVTAERGIREETQDAEPILDNNDDHAPWAASCISGYKDVAPL
ncbi:MAG: hypothetical protein WBP81_32400 [Solirubrobacteraceae bacterium]